MINTKSLLNQQLGPYRIEELIGVGSIGATFQAEDTRSGARVALKYRERQSDPELQQKLLQTQP